MKPWNFPTNGRMGSVVDVSVFSWVGAVLAAAAPYALSCFSMGLRSGTSGRFWLSNTALLTYSRQ